jgi:23S rRNA pseudouridine2604 synthase
MCEYFGYRVEKLVRVRIMNIELGDLRPGEYRMVTGEEYQKLLALVRDSSNLPASQAKHEKQKSVENRNPRKRPTVQKEQKTTGKRVYTVINGTEKK